MPIDESQTPINPILQSFNSFDHQWSIGHLIWRPHSNKTRLKLFTLPYAFDTLKLSTCNSRLFHHRSTKNFLAVEKLVLDATHGTIREINHQLVDMLRNHCKNTKNLQIQNIVLPNQDNWSLPSSNYRKCRQIKHLIINECDGRLFPLVFSLAPCLTTLTVTGSLILKYFLKNSSNDCSYLSRIRTLDLNCMQIDRQNRLNRLLAELASLFPYLEHLTIDINPRLTLDLKYVLTALDVLVDLVSLKIQRTNKYVINKLLQDDRQVRTYFETNSLRLHHSETYEIICKDSQLEFWLWKKDRSVLFVCLVSSFFLFRSDWFLLKKNLVQMTSPCFYFSFCPASFVSFNFVTIALRTIRFFFLASSRRLSTNKRRILSKIYRLMRNRRQSIDHFVDRWTIFSFTWQHGAHRFDQWRRISIRLNRHRNSSAGCGQCHTKRNDLNSTFWTRFPRLSNRFTFSSMWKANFHNSRCQEFTQNNR